MVYPGQTPAPLNLLPFQRPLQPLCLSPFHPLEKHIESRFDRSFVLTILKRPIIPPTERGCFDEE